MTGRRSILLLGGSAQQVIAIEKARELGYRTVLCDYLPNNPGRLVADSFYQVSTTDYGAVLDVARSEHVSGILAYASDPAAPTAAYVAECLGLPGNPLKSVEVLSEKHLFREHLRKSGLPCPKSVSFDSGCSFDELACALRGFIWPIVVKPTDSSGSKGVTVVEDMDGIDAAASAARSYSRNGLLIAEEFIRRSYPNVIGGDIFVVDGEVRFWGLMDCLRDDCMGGMVPVGEMLPTALPAELLERVRDVLSRLVSSLGIVSGEMNVEVIVGEDGEPYVLELGARAGGNMIPVQLSDASGIDLVAASVRCAMGEDPGEVSFAGDGPAVAHLVLHSREAGDFDCVEYGALAPHLYREVLYSEPGDKVASFENAGDAVGIAFFRFGYADEMREMLATSAPRVCLRGGRR